MKAEDRKNVSNANNFSLSSRINFQMKFKLAVGGIKY